MYISNSLLSSEGGRIYDSLNIKINYKIPMTGFIISRLKPAFSKFQTAFQLESESVKT
jgi:hypothetical protein